MPLKKKKKVKKLTRKKPARKKIVKKAVKKKTKVSRKVVARAAKPKEAVVGVVTHYFPHVRAAVIKLKAPLSVGDSIKIKGHTTEFVQKITSMQVDRVPINSAKKGQEIGLLVNSRVRQHDLAYKA